MMASFHKQSLINSLQNIRHARNNMSKEDFLNIVNDILQDPNIAIPVLEVASHVSISNFYHNHDKE